MPRIKINDIPQDQKISKDELKRIRGGIILSSVNLTLNTLSYNQEINDRYIGFVKPVPAIY